MIDFANYEIWFVTGSQHLYGNEVLDKVKANSIVVSAGLNSLAHNPVAVKFKEVVTSSEEIISVIRSANNDDKCIGLITWMHTFSPAKMWINGLKILQKPLLHLHTQFNRDIPWSKIDMDFMNLNQSAHGGREFGHILTKMKIQRKIVVGHWQDEAVQSEVGQWARVALAWRDSQSMKIARFGDNMRDVAVTEGDKVAAQIQFGYSVNGFGLGDLSKYIDDARDQQINVLLEEYQETYILSDGLLNNRVGTSALKEAARIEIGLRSFLLDGSFAAFTNTFENLHGLIQLPGIAVQRLMKDGYGFGAEGDWKTAALVRTMKVMAHGLDGGNSFMEDYTYHFEPGNMQVLGAHMLEICPSISIEQPSCELHPLGIGGKADPVRLVFTAPAGPALNACMIDLGDRFRLLVNTVEAVNPAESLPKLPVARVLWKPNPDLRTAAEKWLACGGAHHTCYSQNITVSHLKDYADLAGIELVVID